jgi:hypothetical protein
MRFSPSAPQVLRSKRSARQNARGLDQAYAELILALQGALGLSYPNQQDPGRVLADPLTRQYYGHPPLRDAILLPVSAQTPDGKYLDWHQANVFAA